MTKRIQLLKNNRKKYAKKEEIPVRDYAYRKAIAEHPEESTKVQYAYGFAQTLRDKSILIQREDVLAGFLYQYTYNINFPMKVDADFDPAGRASFRMDAKREVKEYGELFLAEGDMAETGEFMEFANASEAWLFKHWHSGHTLAGYPMLLDKGFGGLMDEITAEERKEVSKEEKDTLRAFKIVLEGCADYVGRYERLAGKMAAAADDEEEETRMLKIKKDLEKVKHGTPETFAQAIQLVWLAHEMMYCENVPSAISFGRLDYYLYPYYQRDIERGILTEEQAGEYIEAFFIKCSSQRKAYQNLTVGGCDENGKCSVNSLTYLCLKAMKELKLDQPSLTYRWTDDMPEEAWEAVLSLLREGMGFPALMYDGCYRNVMEQRGVPKEKSYNYSILGCVEPAMQGEECALTEMIRLNLPKVLNLMLHDGKDVVSGKQFTLKRHRNLDEIRNYEALWQWYLEEICHFLDLGIRSAKRCEKLYEKKYPLPYLSVLTEDCIHRRKDVSEGGANYYSIGVNLCGIATAADSLMAIKKLVFDEKKLTLDEYAEILRDNYRGAEELRQRALCQCLKYGNDLHEPDETAAEIIATARKVIDGRKTYHGGNYCLGLYSVEDHVIMGMHTGATADGRKRGTSLSNSTGAVQGMDRNGPTALVKSVTHTDMRDALNGMVLDVKFVPAFLEQQTGANAVRQLINAYFHHGGMELQISVVSEETLREAQKNPEQYQDLIVRVSGFSAYFVTLRKETQDEIIRRTACE